MAGIGGSWGRIVAAASVCGIAIVGCGGGSKLATTGGSTQTTMAQVCASHPEDIGNIAAGLLAFKVAMESGDTTSLASIAEKVTGAVSDLQSAAVGATSANLPAMRSFLQLLQSLSSSYTTPPTYPTAYIGDHDVAEIEHEAKQVGCTV